MAYHRMYIDARGRVYVLSLITWAYDTYLQAPASQDMEYSCMLDGGERMISYPSLVVAELFNTYIARSEIMPVVKVQCSTLYIP